jgi:hypothetical protein
MLEQLTAWFPAASDLCSFAGLLQYRIVGPILYRQKEPKVLVRIIGQARLAATAYSLERWSGCAASPADMCSRHRSRKEWEPRSTMKPQRR